MGNAPRISVVGRAPDGLPELAIPCPWRDPDDATLGCTLRDGHRPMTPGWKGHAPTRLLLPASQRRFPRSVADDGG